MRKTKIFFIAVSIGLLSTFYFNCANSHFTYDNLTATAYSTQFEEQSVSGIAVAAIGGAIASTSQTGQFASVKQNFDSQAYADNHCPTFLSSGPSSGCANDLVNTNALTLTYQNCNFGTSLFQWSGILRATETNGTAVHCGTFPIVNNTALERQFVDSAGTPASAQKTSPTGSVITVDHAATSGTLANFDNQQILPTIGSGYGTSVSFDTNQQRTQAVIAEHVSAKNKNALTIFDLTVNGTVNLSESSGTRTITGGSMTTYHNVLKIIGTSTFSNVRFNDTCCTPIAGSVATTFSASTDPSNAPTTVGARFVGLTETLTFSSCGKGKFTSGDGITQAFFLDCF